jgi:hypothetical protein
MITIDVQFGNAFEYKADVLMIKYAPRSGGLDARVRSKLREAGLDERSTKLEPSAYSLVESPPDMSYRYVLTVGTVNIFQFGYEELRVLAEDMLSSLYDAGIEVEHVATTLHGINSRLSLDEVEALRSMVLGFFDAIDAGHVPPSLKRITFIERESYRAELIEKSIKEFAPTTQIRTESLNRPLATEATPHVFVAMPFADDYDDHYYLAIRPAITACDVLCIRLDQKESTFTGDIMDQVRSRIESAKLVVALLDGRNPNVYLEVGYAWGVGTPTLLVLHEDETPPFDVQGARLLHYRQLYKLKNLLSDEIKRLLQ